MLPALPTEKPRANRLAASSTSRCAGFALVHRHGSSTSNALRKKSRRAEIARLQRQQQRRRAALRHRSTARRDRSPRRCAGCARRAATPPRPRSRRRRRPCGARRARRDPRRSAPASASISAPAASRPSRCCNCGDLVGRRRRGDDDRRGAELAARPSQRAVRDHARRIRRGQRIELQHRHMRRARSQAAPSVAREHEPASTAAWPDTAGSAAGIAASGSKPARRKFSGSPIATPEPPVISACCAAASPIATRCASLTASTMA